MRKGIRERLSEGVVLGDGGYLLELEKRGFVRAGPFTPEVSIINPWALEELHREFMLAGAEVLQTLTFYASEEKLATVGLADKVDEINRAATEIARKVAAEGDALVAGTLSITWAYDPAVPDSAVRVREMFDRQLAQQLAVGVDFVIGETFTTLGEALIALESIKAAGLPAMITMAFEHKDTTHDGYTAAECGKSLEANGADIVGINCLRNPETMMPLLHEMISAVSSSTYIAAQPVAYETHNHDHNFTSLPGFPFGLDPYQLPRTRLADFAVRAHDMGVRYIGSCCGSVAAHVREMARALGKLPPDDTMEVWKQDGGRPKSAYEYHRKRRMEQETI
ncbi:MAG: homocysteine S-methyltransferase family protein [Blastochloris sp.]|nr:homocysteine S-methyltransferase family protein [Chloroflexaceae bacterium]NJO83071.1 homocysteine S-methyltransferase family protein [Blastochloris sp.]